MRTYKCPYSLISLFFLWACCMSMSSFGQGAYYKFPVVKEGVYKITANQARQMGASSVDELRILGHHGVLEQKLDSSSLQLQEIQVQKKGDELFFYLSGPHFHQMENEQFQYQHHPYTDTLFYLVQTGQVNQKAITSSEVGENQGSIQTEFLYAFSSQKVEFYNLLNSGRKWYGNRTFNGQRADFFFPSLTQDAPVYFHYSVMGQSLAESQFLFQLNDQEVQRTTVSSIPASTYSLKGRESASSGFFNLPKATGLKASFIYTTGDANGTGYIDYITLGLPQNTSDLNDGIYYLPEPKSFFLPQNGKFYWDITENVQEILPGNTLAESIRKIAVFSASTAPPISAFVPIDLGLRNYSSSSELLIISTAELKGQAEKLAAHRNKMGVSATVVLLGDIYNSFGYGNRDVTAIRNFVAHQKLANGQLKNLLLFGKGTYDYKFLSGGRPNLIPIYTSRGSLNPLATYSSDDYYGFLEWGDGEWEEDNAGDHQLSIGVGRLPVVNVREAATVVEKLIAYDDIQNNLGEWKRKILLFADDGDNNLHLRDSEKHAALLHQRHPEFVLEKLYLDAFPQITSNDRVRSPAAQAALLDQVREGVLLINYVGHGNETTLTAEQVFTTTQLEDWPERTDLPVLVTATCEFGRHDSPFSRSGAEEMLTLRGKGAIGLLTTGRPVFSSANYALNKAFMDEVFQKIEGAYLSLGEIYMLTKNNSTNGVLNRSFALLGDPSMKLALPDLEAKPHELREMDLDISIDTLNAFQKVQIKGKIKDPLTQSTISGFEGEYLITMSDKPIQEKTLGNQGPAITYLDENTVVFRGTGKINMGEFTAEAFIPENIQEDFGLGTIKVFALDKLGNEAFGASAINIGGRKSEKPQDTDGPQIRMMVQDSSRMVRNIVSTTVPFFAFLEDESGINVTSSNKDRNLVLTINGNKQYTLNKYYIAVDGGYRKGVVMTTITGLREGMNLLSLTAFDNLGNSSTQELEVLVEGSLQLRITDLRSYPNPATESSRFRWAHNRSGENLTMSLRIFNIMGSEIFSFSRRFPNAAAVLDDVEWIFLQSKTKYPAKGTYIYELVLQSEADGTSDRKSGKLFIQ